MDFKNPYLRLLQTDLADKVFSDRGRDIPLYKPPEGNLELFKPTRWNLTGCVNIDIFLKHFSQSYGLTGSGKSNGVSRLCEQLLLKHVKLFIVDKKGEFITLTGLRGANVKIYRMMQKTFEDEKAQIEARREEGAALAVDYLDGNASIVLNLGGERAEDYLPFLLQFFSDLWQKRKEEKMKADAEGRPTIPNKTIIEEAKNFVPQFPDANLSNKMKEISLGLISIVKSISTEGRSFGETTHLSSQRPMQLDSSIRGQGEVFFFYKQTYPNELEFYLKMMPHERGDRDKLKIDFAEMKSGSCYFVKFGSAEYVNMRKKKTKDMASTPGYAELMGWKNGNEDENASGGEN